MKKGIIAVALAAALVGPLLAQGGATLEIGIQDGKIRNFYLSLGDYFGVEAVKLAQIRQKYINHIQDEEFPVIMMISSRAGVEPGAVISLRLRGRSWFQIATQLRVRPDVFFVDMGENRIGEPYGRAYGYYKKFGRGGKWGTASLSDREMIDLANLKFESEYHKMPPARVMEMRGQTQSFVEIHNNIRNEKTKGQDKDHGSKGPHGKDDRGPGKDKGKPEKPKEK